MPFVRFVGRPSFVVLNAFHRRTTPGYLWLVQSARKRISIIRAIPACWIQRRKPNPEHYKRLVNVRSLNLAFPWHRCSKTYTTSLPMTRYFLGSALQELSVESFEDMVGTRRTFRTVIKLRSKGPAILARLTEFDLPLLEDLDVGVSVLALIDRQIMFRLNDFVVSKCARRFGYYFYLHDTSCTHLGGRWFRMSIHDVAL